MAARALQRACDQCCGCLPAYSAHSPSPVLLPLCSPAGSTAPKAQPALNSLGCCCCCCHERFPWRLHRCALLASAARRAAAAERQRHREGLALHCVAVSLWKAIDTGRSGLGPLHCAAAACRASFQMPHALHTPCLPALCVPSVPAAAAPGLGAGAASAPAWWDLLDASKVGLSSSSSFCVCVCCKRGNRSEACWCVACSSGQQLAKGSAACSWLCVAALSARKLAVQRVGRVSGGDSRRSRPSMLSCSPYACMHVCFAVYLCISCMPACLCACRFGR